MPTTARGAVAQDERVAARAVVPDERMGLDGHVLPRSQLLLGRLRERFEEGGLHAVDHPHVVQPLLLVIGQIVVGGVGVHELGLSPGRA